MNLRVTVAEVQNTCNSTGYSGEYPHLKTICERNQCSGPDWSCSFGRQTDVHGGPTSDLHDGMSFWIIELEESILTILVVVTSVQ